MTQLAGLLVLAYGVFGVLLALYLIRRLLQQQGWLNRVHWSLVVALAQLDAIAKVLRRGLGLAAQAEPVVQASREALLSLAAKRQDIETWVAETGSLFSTSCIDLFNIPIPQLGAPSTLIPGQTFSGPTVAFDVDAQVVGDYAGLPIYGPPEPDLRTLELTLPGFSIPVPDVTVCYPATPLASACGALSDASAAVTRRCHDAFETAAAAEQILLGTQEYMAAFKRDLDGLPDKLDDARSTLLRLSQPSILRLALLAPVVLFGLIHLALALIGAGLLLV